MKSNSLDILKHKESGFKVPEGYFDTVEDTVVSELIARKFPKQHGFSTPKDYFTTIENTVTSTLIEDQLPIKEGFKIPENYFNSLEASVLQKLDKDVPQVQTTNIPKDYFDTLEDRIFSRLEAEELAKKETKVISLSSRLKKAIIPLSVAASLLLIITIGYNRPTVDDGSEIVVIDELIEDDLINLDSYEIAEVFSDIDLASNDTNDEDVELLEYLNGTDIENMLLEN